GRFTTQSQNTGQRAFVERSLSWPAANVLTARAFIRPESAAIQFHVKVVGLETKGPGSWATRAGFALGPTTFGALYTGRDGVARYLNTGRTYQVGQWYEVSIVVDYRG